MESDLQLPEHVARLSHSAAVLCLLAGAAWPLLTWVALMPMEPAELLERGGLAVLAAKPWGSALYAEWQRTAVLALLVLPAVCSGWALACLGRGFRALASGPGALLQAHAALQRFCGWTVGATLASVVAGVAASVVLTLNHPPGQRQLALGLSSAQIQGLLMAALVWVFAHLVLRARAVAEDNAGFI